MDNVIQMDLYETRGEKFVFESGENVRNKCSDDVMDLNLRNHGPGPVFMKPLSRIAAQQRLLLVILYYLRVMQKWSGIGSWEEVEEESS